MPVSISFSRSQTPWAVFAAGALLTATCDIDDVNHADDRYAQVRLQRQPVRSRITTAFRRFDVGSTP